MYAISSVFTHTITVIIHRHHFINIPRIAKFHAPVLQSSSLKYSEGSL